MSPAAIEKDFWVCWILQRLFRSPLKDSIIFKGGTSLSKVYGLIKRFSEDIDLILNWNGFCRRTEWNPGEHYSNSKRNKMTNELDAWNARQVAQAILPIVRECCGGTCSAEISQKSEETIVITYPRNFVGYYIIPQILLEIGPKAAWNPHEERVVCPYMATFYPQLFEDAVARVKVTTAQRAFWEKVTILHAQVNRRTPLPFRYARHYYDTVMMARNQELKKSAFSDVRLLYRVASFKHYFYRAGWTDYLNAIPGKMHLIPSANILRDLEGDYGEMRKEMLPEDAPSLDVILDELQQLEREINELERLNLDVGNYPTMRMEI